MTKYKCLTFWTPSTFTRKREQLKGKTKMSTPEQNERIAELVKEAAEYINNGEKDKAKPLIDEILESDPESPDGHILASHLYNYYDPEREKHLRFVVDRDIKHSQPWGLRGLWYDFVTCFLELLKSKIFRNRKEDTDQQKEFRELVDYSYRALEADIPVPDLYDFCETLLVMERYDDIVKIGSFLTKDMSAAETGWPGIAKCDKHNQLDALHPVVMSAFLESKRYVEGCRWILKCLREKTDDEYLWFLLGQSLTWLGYPEETARAWIIALEKGNFTITERDLFETLAHKLTDPLYDKKEKLYDQVFQLRDKITPGIKEAFEEVLHSISRSIHLDSQPIPSKDFIQKKLGMPLEENSKNKFKYNAFREDRIIVPPKKSTDPVVQEIIDFIDNYIEEELKTIEGKPTENAGITVKKEKVKAGGPSGPGAYDVTLAQYGINITEMAARGEIPPVIGREKEIDRVVRILSRSEKNNPVLLGEAGVGKTAVVYGLAQRIVSSGVPEILKNKTIYELNVGAMVAGTTYRGDFEERMNNIIKEMRNDPGKILFIDEFHMLIGAGDSKGKMDASNILKPALSAGEIRLIGATTSREYSRSIEHDAAFERRFSPVWLNELTPETTYLVLKARVPMWEKHHGVLIYDEVIRSSILLADQYLRHRNFPDKAIDLIDEACSYTRINSINISEKVNLNTETLKKICEEWTGASNARMNLSQNIVNEIEQQLQQFIVGHENILKRLSTMIVDERLGLYTSMYPRILLFYGSSCSGKTECAKALSKILWPGEKERFLYIDMELLNDYADLNRLTGAPRGTIGSDEGGKLSSHLRQNPNTIIFLKNFHKSNERIIQFFINLFREGLFSDGSGETVYVRNAIFIISAVIEQNSINIGFGNNSKENSENDKSDEILLRLNFPKEIIPLIKEIYKFDEPDDGELKEIIRRKIKSVKDQPAIRELDIQISDEVVDKMIRYYRNQSSSFHNIQGLIERFVYSHLITGN